MLAITLKTLLPVLGVLSQLVTPAEAKLKIVNTKQAPLAFWSGWGAKQDAQTAWDSSKNRKFSFEQNGGPIAECEIVTVGSKQGDVTMDIYAVGKYYWLTRCGCEDGWRLDCKMRASRERLLCEKAGVRPDQC